MSTSRFVPFAVVFAFLQSFSTDALAQPSLHSIVLVGEEGIAKSIAIPRGITITVRAEGRDAAGQRVAFDPGRVTWSVTGTAFGIRKEHDRFLVTAIKDAFDLTDGREPSETFIARLEGKSVVVTFTAVLNVSGEWIMNADGKPRPMFLVQSGRSVKSKSGHVGTVRGKRLDLTVVHVIRIIGIPKKLTLHPKIDFTRRSYGAGSVSAPTRTVPLIMTRPASMTP